jgi:hypothetical protein
MYYPLHLNLHKIYFSCIFPYDLLMICTWTQRNTVLLFNGETCTLAKINVSTNSFFNFLLCYASRRLVLCRLLLSIWNGIVWCTQKFNVSTNSFFFLSTLREKLGHVLCILLFSIWNSIVWCTNSFFSLWNGIWAISRSVSWTNYIYLISKSLRAIGYFCTYILLYVTPLIF